MREVIFRPILSLLINLGVVPVTTSPQYAVVRDPMFHTMNMENSHDVFEVKLTLCKRD
jgi:hypothetical protein